MNLNFGQVEPSTTELVALKRLKLMFPRFLVYPTLFNLASNKDMHTILVGPSTTEVAALERLKYLHRRVSPLFQLFWSYPFDTFS